jgi:hypothetical protein
MSSGASSLLAPDWPTTWLPSSPVADGDPWRPRSSRPVGGRRSLPPGPPTPSPPRPAPGLLPGGGPARAAPILKVDSSSAASCVLVRCSGSPAWGLGGGRGREQRDAAQCTVTMQVEGGVTRPAAWGLVREPKVLGMVLNCWLICTGRTGSQPPPLAIGTHTNTQTHAHTPWRLTLYRHIHATHTQACTGWQHLQQHTTAAWQAGGVTPAPTAASHAARVPSAVMTAAPRRRAPGLGHSRR